MRVHNEDVLHGVVVALVHADNTLAPAVLVAVGAGGYALDVPALAEGDYNLFVGL